MTRVLVTGGASVGPLAAVRALRRAGYEPVYATAQPADYAARSRAVAGVVAVRDSRADAKAFVAGLAAAPAIAALLPGTEPDLLALAAHRDALPAGTALGIPPLDVVRRATDKQALPVFARAAGLCTPPAVELGPGGPEPAGWEPSFPLILKPPASERAGGAGFVHRDARYVADAEQLRVALAELGAGERWSAQPYLPGPLCAVSGVAWEGRLVCAVHQTARRIGPRDAGMSAYAETVAPRHDLQEGVGRLLAALGWSGIFQAQFIRTRDGEHLIDFNPRVYGSLALAVAAGSNLPAIWVDLLLGRGPEATGYRPGVRYRHEERDAQALLAIARGGRPVAALRGLLPHRRTTHAIVRLSDPLPALASLGALRATLRSGRSLVR